MFFGNSWVRYILCTIFVGCVSNCEVVEYHYIHVSISIGECVCVCVCVYPSKRIHVAVCGPIGTKFGTHMQNHLEKVVGKIKICPVSQRGNLGGF